MNSQSPQTPRIVVLAAIDGSDVSDDVISTAANLCQTLGAELHLVHVAEPLPEPGGANAVVMSVPKLLESAHSVLEAVIARARETFGGRIVGHLAAGAPSREVLQLATDLQADLIVVGSHRKNRVERWLLGSVSDQIIRKASCAVLLARPKQYPVTVPEIEPPCPDCVALQSQTRGEQLWCARHDRKSKHPHGRTHYESPQTFAVGSLLIRPEG